MMPVICSAAELPFRDRSFDAVIASDVMEHVPPEKRPAVIAEILRVAGRIAVFGYPCGTAAHALDQKLHGHYVSRRMSPPIWLEEHMLYPFPTEDLFRSVRQGWKMKTIPNESLNFHYWMMRREMLPSLNHLFRASLALAPHLIEYLLRMMDRLPSYRTIFVLVRTEPTT
jgi:ubiquinone/menaquinone biosynthesis C-methylase UbiE